MSLSLPKVLLVEDDDILREVNATKLELEGFDYATANNGREALAVVQNYEPDIILLDMTMPVMNGPEFLREYQKAGGSSNVIIFSNVSSPESTREVMSLGAKEYLNKSRFTPGELVEHLKSFWAKQTAA